MVGFNSDELRDINPFPNLEKSFVVPGLENCLDISFVSPDRIWVYDGETLFLTNTSGDILHKIIGSYTCTANGNGMVYLDRKRTCWKFSYKNKESCRVFLFFRDTYSWFPEGIYLCPSKSDSDSDSDLLVGMKSRSNPLDAVVVRYSKEGNIRQTIEGNERDPLLYVSPRYITENNNGDIVVSDPDRSGLVVTNCQGELRFFLLVDGPKGVCTDTFSNILLCRTSTEILVIDVNGLFLCYLSLDKSPTIAGTLVFKNLHKRYLQDERPNLRNQLCLSYDDNEDLLWVGTNDSNTVSAYKISRTGKKLTLQSKSDLAILFSFFLIYARTHTHTHTKNNTCINATSLPASSLI